MNVGATSGRGGRNNRKGKRGEGGGSGPRKKRGLVAFLNCQTFEPHLPEIAGKRGGRGQRVKNDTKSPFGKVAPCHEKRSDLIIRGI